MCYLGSSRSTLKPDFVGYHLFRDLGLCFISQTFFCEHPPPTTPPQSLSLTSWHRSPCLLVILYTVVPKALPVTLGGCQNSMVPSLYLYGMPQKDLVSVLPGNMALSSLSWRGAFHFGFIESHCLLDALTVGHKNGKHGANNYRVPSLLNWPKSITLLLDGTQEALLKAKSRPTFFPLWSARALLNEDAFQLRTFKRHFLLTSLGRGHL